MTQKEILKHNYKFMPIKDFIEKYKTSFTIEAIAYHMSKDYIDWYQPARDKFVVLSNRTKNFYKEKDPLFFNLKSKDAK